MGPEQDPTSDPHSTGRFDNANNNAEVVDRLGLTPCVAK